MQQRQDGGQELLASTKAVLNKQSSAWKAGCDALGHLLLQLSQAHDAHADGHQALKAGVKDALALTKQVRQLQLCCPPLNCEAPMRHKDRARLNNIHFIVFLEYHTHRFCRK